MPVLVSRDISIKKAGSAWAGRCPFHNDSSPSLIVYQDHAHCYGCGHHVNPITWLMELHGMSFADAVADLLGTPAESQGSKFERRLRDDAREYAEAQGKHFDHLPEERQRAAIARAIWENRRPIAGSLAERYLRETRGIRAPYPPMLGFATSLYFSPARRERPALLAALQDSHNEFCSIQRIYLDPDSGKKATPAKEAKRTKGPMRDGAVRLARPGKIFGLAGSVEDALAVIRTFSIPCWATCGEARLKSVWIPDGVEELVIFGDNDEQGRKFAMEAVIAHDEKQKYDRVYFELPPKAKDWNENLLEASR